MHFEPDAFFLQGNWDSNFGSNYALSIRPSPKAKEGGEQSDAPEVPTVRPR